MRRVDRRLPAPDADAALDGLTVVQLSDFHAGFRPSLNLRAARKAVDLALAAAAGPRRHHRRLRRRDGWASASCGASCCVCAPPLGVFGVLRQPRPRRQQGAVRAADGPALRRGLRRPPPDQRDGDRSTRRRDRADRRRRRHGRRARRPAGGAGAARPPARRAAPAALASRGRGQADGARRLPHDLRRRHARRPDLPAAARPPGHAQRPAAPSSPRGATTSAAALCTSRAASAPACCRSGPSAGPEVVVFHVEAGG